MKILALIFGAIGPCVLCCCGQTATVPPAPVTGTAHINGQSASCTVPKNGGKCTFTFPAYDAPVAGTTAATTADVSLKGFTGSGSCRLGPNSQVITNPDGTKTVTDVECTITAAK